MTVGTSAEVGYGSENWGRGQGDLVLFKEKSFSC